jgi:hypothetical protein
MKIADLSPEERHRIRAMRFESEDSSPPRHKGAKINRDLAPLCLGGEESGVG